jgi:tetratricopeptide (TPR) repeat protein
VKPDDAEKLPLDAYRPWLESKRQAPPPLSSPGSPIDSRLEAIVRRCLAVEARDRYGSAAKLAADLRAYLAAGPTLGRFVKRHRRAVLLAAVGMLGSGMGLAGYIGNRPSHIDLLYQQGLDQYNQGKYAEAEKKFTQCLVQEPGWPQAVFGRGQSLLRQTKWREARADFMALADIDRAWAFALAGYCNMRLRDNEAAAFDFNTAHGAGLRDVGFLLNYARTQTNRQWHSRAAELYSEVIAIDPHNRAALRNRGLAYVASVKNNDQLPDKQAFDDAAKYLSLEPVSFEAPYCAAIIFGEAARKNPEYNDLACAHLRQAIAKGMPLNLVGNFPAQLQRLLDQLDRAATEGASPRDPNYRLAFAPPEEPPRTSDWAAFERQFGSQSRVVARGP